MLFIFKSSEVSLSHIYFSIKPKKKGQQPVIKEWKTKFFKSDARSHGKTLELVFKSESVAKVDLYIDYQEEPGDLTLSNHKSKMQANVARERVEEERMLRSYNMTVRKNEDLWRNPTDDQHLYRINIEDPG